MKEERMNRGYAELHEPRQNRAPRSEVKEERLKEAALDEFYHRDHNPRKLSGLHRVHKVNLRVRQLRTQKTD